MKKINQIGKFSYGTENIKADDGTENLYYVISKEREGMTPVRVVDKGIQYYPRKPARLFLTEEEVDIVRELLKK